MEHLQDLGKFSDKILKRMAWGAYITNDQKAWRKFKEETERRRRNNSYRVIPDESRSIANQLKIGKLG